MEQDPLTPGERELWEEAAGVLGDELAVQVAIGRPTTPDGTKATARILLDALWRRYELRRRPSP